MCLEGIVQPVLSAWHCVSSNMFKLNTTQPTAISYKREVIQSICDNLGNRDFDQGFVSFSQCRVFESFNEYQRPHKISEAKARKERAEMYIEAVMKLAVTNSKGLSQM